MIKVSWKISSAISRSSILENIAFAKDKEQINIKDVWKAIDSARLKELVENLPEGLNTNIGDSGIKTSNDKISISSIVPNKNQPRKIFEKESLTGGTITMDMQTISCIDLDGDAKKQLESHLLSDDFFGTNFYPTAELEILETEKKEKFICLNAKESRVKLLAYRIKQIIDL